MRIFLAIVAALFGVMLGFVVVGVLACVILGFIGYFILDGSEEARVLVSSVAVCLTVAAAIGSAWFCARAVLNESAPREKEIRRGDTQKSPNWLKQRMSGCRPDE
jgi:hypothetical protein